MAVSVRASQLSEIEPLREKYRAEMNCQIIHDSIHERVGWTREFSLHLHDRPVIGYGSVAVAGPWRENPAIYEYFIVPEHRLRNLRGIHQSAGLLRCQNYRDSEQCASATRDASCLRTERTNRIDPV